MKELITKALELVEKIKQSAIGKEIVDPFQLSSSLMLLAAYNINIGTETEKLRAEADDLAAALDIEKASILLAEKDKGATDKVSEAQAKVQTQELKSAELEKVKQYKYLLTLGNRIEKAIIMGQSHLRLCENEKKNINI